MTHVRPRRGRTLVPAVLTGILLVSAGCSPAADPSPGVHGVHGGAGA